MTALNFVLRFVVQHATAKVAIWVGTVSAASGAVLTVLLMRTLALAQIAAQDIDHSGRMTKIEVEADTTGLKLNRRVDSLAVRMNQVEENTGTLILAECLRSSKVDQRLIGMTCPAELYRGAPR